LFQGGQFVTWFDPLKSDNSTDQAFPIHVKVVGSTIFILAYSQEEQISPILYKCSLVDTVTGKPSNIITPTTTV
jgi:hypothetical protein